MRAGSPHQLQAHFGAYKPCGCLAARTMQAHVGAYKPCGLAARTSCKPMLELTSHVGWQPAPAASPCWSLQAMRAGSPHQLQAHVGAYKPCGLAARTSCKPMLELTSHAGWQHEPAASPCWSLQAMRAGSPHQLQAHVGAYKPCGLAARTSCKPMLELTSHAGWQPAPAASPCWSLQAMRAGSPHQLQAHVGAYKPCGLAARTTFKPMLELTRHAGWQPAPAASPCWSLQAMWAGSPHQLQAHVGAYKPCGLAARTSCKPMLELTSHAGWQPAPAASPCWSLQAMRAGSPHQLQAHVGAYKPCGLAARTSCKPMLELTSHAGWQPAPAASPCWSLQAMRAGSPHQLQAHVGAYKPCGLAARTSCKPMLELTSHAGPHYLQAHVGAYKPCGLAARTSCKPMLELTSHAGPHYLQAHVGAYKPCGLAARTSCKPMLKLTSCAGSGMHHGHLEAKAPPSVVPVNLWQNSRHVSNCDYKLVTCTFSSFKSPKCCYCMWCFCILSSTIAFVFGIIMQNVWVVLKMMCDFVASCKLHHQPLKSEALKWPAPFHQIAKFPNGPSWRFKVTIA